MKIRKLIQLLFLSILGLSSCKKDEFTVECLPDNLRNGVIAFYPFKNGLINDESPHNNDLSNTTGASATSDREGNSDCAYVFDYSTGHNEFLTTMKSDFLNGLNSFSISVWYEPLDTSNFGSNLEVLVGRGTGLKCPDRKGEWSLGLYDGRRAVLGHNNSIWVASGSDPTNEWHHVVATKNNDNYKIYFDGSLHDQVNGNGACPSLHLAQDIGDLFIGYEYTGKLDDILIYNRELTAQEIIELFELEACCN